MKDARNMPAFQVRLTEELHKFLKHAAIESHRSMNGEVLYRLEQSRKQEQSAQSATGK